jgi:hypothetical protein
MPEEAELPVLPAVEPVLPVVDPVLPVVEPVLPVVDPVLPVVEPVLPVVEPALPIVPADAPLNLAFLRTYSPLCDPDVAALVSLELVPDARCKQPVAVTLFCDLLCPAVEDVDCPDVLVVGCPCEPVA